MNDTYKKISEYLHQRSISLLSSVRLSDCKIIRPYLLERAEINAESGSAIIIAVPYATESFGNGNISEYAKSSKRGGIYFVDRGMIGESGKMRLWKILLKKGNNIVKK